MGETSGEFGAKGRIVDGNYDRSCAVRCINGTFVGRRTDGVIAHLGIPFVRKQPTGELRWKAPVDYVADDGVYEACHKGKAPLQNRATSRVSGIDACGEDCLYLNVWRADDDGAEQRPVMVWIHGGAFEMGGAVEPIYDCHAFVSENPDVIVVSLEYRLNVFGFLHLAHLEDGADYPDAQNLGILDQLQALKWVHENIAAFGGDPQNVTIFGQSAGGASVTLLPLVEGSHAYFHRVIAQSGSPALTRSSQEAIQCTNELMDALGCKTVADLQRTDVDRLVRASAMLGLRVFPERDGRLLPDDPYAAYAEGAATDIAFIQGCNKDEVIWAA